MPIAMSYNLRVKHCKEGVMTDNIRSTEDIIKEKIARLGDITPEDRWRWRYMPEGERLAVRYLATEDLDLGEEIEKYPPEGRSYLIKGVEGVLLKNIELPRSEASQARSKKAMAGLRVLKQDKRATDRILSQIHTLFDHYCGPGARQRKQAYEAFRENFRRQLDQALGQLGSSVAIGAHLESLPQFQEEWRRREIQLDAEYERMLDEYRRELREID